MPTFIKTPGPKTMKQMAYIREATDVKASSDQIIRACVDIVYRALLIEETSELFKGPIPISKRAYVKRRGPRDRLPGASEEMTARRAVKRRREVRRAPEHR